MMTVWWILIETVKADGIVECVKQADDVGMWNYLEIVLLCSSIVVLWSVVLLVCIVIIIVMMWWLTSSDLTCSIDVVMTLVEVTVLLTAGDHVTLETHAGSDGSIIIVNIILKYIDPVEVLSYWYSGGVLMMYCWWYVTLVGVMLLL